MPCGAYSESIPELTGTPAVTHLRVAILGRAAPPWACDNGRDKQADAVGQAQPGLSRKSVLQLECEALGSLQAAGPARHDVTSHAPPERSGSVGSTLRDKAVTRGWTFTQGVSVW